MGGKLYVGVSGTARRVKKMYVGVNGVARKVKKLYVGVNGIARKVFGGGIVYIGTTADGMSAAGRFYRATCNANYAMFAGRGQTVCAYNSSLTLNTTASLLYKTDYPAATHIGNYALFAGGLYYSNSEYLKKVNAFNLSLTRSNPSDLTANNPYKSSGTHIGNYAIIFGSYSGLGGAKADCYNTSLTRSSAASSVSFGTIYDGAATHNNTYAVFAGGWNGSDYRDSVYAFDSSLTLSQPSVLSVAKKQFAAAHAGEYALFAGGKTSNSNSNVVEAYNDSLTKTTPTALSQYKYDLGGTAIAGGEYAMFGGGYWGGSPSTSDVVEAYDTGLVKTIETSLSLYGTVYGATHIGDYALFGGGDTGDPRAGVVDVYQYE